MTGCLGRPAMHKDVSVAPPSEQINTSHGEISMQLQSRLLTVAIVSALAASAPALAGKFDSSAAIRAQGLIDGPAARAVRRAPADA